MQTSSKLPIQSTYGLYNQFKHNWCLRLMFGLMISVLDLQLRGTEFKSVVNFFLAFGLFCNMFFSFTCLSFSIPCYKGAF